MANLKDIKGRINSVKSTQKITNAMKLVSAAKFARANHAVEAARPYSAAFLKMIARLIAAQGEQALAQYLQSNDASPFLEKREEKRVLLVVLATDRGLCGGLNSNLFKATQKFIKEKKSAGIDVDLLPCGRRAVLFSRRTQLHVVDRKEKVFEQATHAHAEKIGDQLIEYYKDGKYDAVYLLYANFHSALEQLPIVDQFLPIGIEMGSGDLEGSEAVEDLIVEPSLDQFINHLLERLLYGKVYQALLNGTASEHGARMTAMDAATNNAKEVIQKLTLQYNRARQAAITTELTEIISGAEALN
ncbi:MAG: ATP synthase F1 subunit gamma [Oligoflexus sp.]